MNIFDKILVYIKTGEDHGEKAYNCPKLLTFVFQLKMCCME